MKMRRIIEILDFGVINFKGDVDLPRICMNRALNGFVGLIMLVPIMFPVSLSRAKTDESLIATTNTFFSKPCTLQLSNCKEMMPEQISLAMCFVYNTVASSMSTREICK